MVCKIQKCDKVTS